MTGYDVQLTHFLGKGVGANALSRAGQTLFSQGFLVSRLSALNPTTMINFAAAFSDVVISEGYVEGGEQTYVLDNFKLFHLQSRHHSVMQDSL